MPVAAAKPRRHDRSRYEGKNLLRLLLALGLPAFILYLRIVFLFAADTAGSNHGPGVWLVRASYLVLLIFVIVQAFCARYVQRLLQPAKTRLLDALQYLAIFAMCVFFSITGAIACEAFGYNLFLRVAQSGR